MRPRSVIGMLLLLLSGAAASSSPPPSSVVRLGVSDDGWPPFVIVHDGAVTGFSVALLDRLLSGSGLQRQTVLFADEASVQAALCRGEIDLVLTAGTPGPNDTCMAVTMPYYGSVPVIVARRQSGIDATHLDKRTLALPTALPISDALRQAGMRGLAVPSLPAALAAVRDGHAAAVVDNPLVLTYLLRGGAYPALEVAGPAPVPAQDVRFGAPRGREELLERLNRALQELPANEFAQLQQPWIGKEGASPYQLPLTADEDAWVRHLPPLRVGWDTDSPPFSFVDERGQPNGISPTYLGEMGRAIGLKFQYESSGHWGQTLADVKRFDLIMGMTADEAEQAGLLATQSYASFPVVAVSRTADDRITRLQDVANARIVFKEADSAPIARLAKRLSNDVRVVATAADGLREVAQGDADVYLGNLAVVDQLIRETYPSTLRVVAPTDLHQSLVMGVRPAYRPLVGLLDRALQAMPVAERARVRSAWIGPTDRYTYDFRATLEKLTPALIAIGIALIALAVVNRRLRHEMTRREVAETEAREQWAFQRALMDTVPFPILALNVQDSLYDANAAFERIYADALSDLGTGSLPVPFDALMDPTAVFIGVERELHGADTDQTVLYWQRPVLDEAGQLRSVLSAAVDITPIRRAEEQARRAHERLKTVTRHLPGIVFELQRTDAGRLHFPYIAGNTDALFGLSPEDMMIDEALALDAVIPDDRAPLMQALQKSYDQAVPFMAEFRTHPNGRMHWVRAHAVIFRRTPSLTAWSGHWVDVTDEHMQAEALQRARAASDAAARAKSIFLATMSHEIRTPMSGIVGMLELLAQTTLDREQTYLVGTLNQTTHVLEQILDDVLDFSKIDAGQMVLQPADTDLRELIDSTANAFAPLAAAKGVRLRVRIDEDVPARLRLDPGRVRQVVANLISNAVKFTDTGCIDIRANSSNRSAQDTPPPVLVITVADTGIGIAPDALHRLFAPFTQADGSTSRRYGGTGLGLSISRQLAQLMNGTLDLSSQPERGTLATFRIPCAGIVMSNDGGGEARPVWIDVGDADDATVLTERLAHLGFRRSDGPENAALCITERSDPPFQQTDICVTGQFLPAGLSHRNGRPLISLSPLRGEALAMALEEALPTFAADARATAAPGIACLARRGRVLVAEDNPVNQELIQRQLRLLGQDVTLVPDGEAALRALQVGTFDLLLTDCHMQPMDGFDLARAIRRREAMHGGHLPVIAITAMTTGDASHPWTEAGMDDYLAKPVRLSDLRTMLSRWLLPDADGRDDAADASDSPPEPSEALTELIAAMGSAEAVRAFVLMAIADVHEALRRLDADQIHPVCLAFAAWLHRQSGMLRMFGSNPLMTACSAAEERLQRTPSPEALAHSLALLPALLRYATALADWAEGKRAAFPKPPSAPRYDDEALR